MFNFFHPFFKKLSDFFLLMLLFSAAVLQSACGGDSKTSKTNSSTLQAPPEGSTKDLTADFPTLFLRNYKIKDSNQLEMLLDQGSPKPQKVVFQFFHNSDNQLTLIANAGRQNHKNFSFFNYVPILENLKEYPTPKIDITGKKVFLADQEISNENIDGRDFLNELKLLKNTKDYEYITFSPRLAPGRVTGQYYIVYDLGRIKKADFKKNIAIRLLPEPIGDLSLNPSPPRDGY